jgi:Flp pilus assembly protein TadG
MQRARTGIPRALRLLRDTSGVNLLEAAIVAPLLLLLTFGIVDFASIFYAYLALENGASEATRFAVTGNQQNDPNNPGQVLSRTDSIKMAMRQATPTLTIPDAAFTFSHMAPGGGWVAGTGGPNDIEKVSIDYTWNVMTPIIRPFFDNGQIRLHVESAMKNEGRFQ